MAFKNQMTAHLWYIQLKMGENWRIH